jgi:hypothetical protein
MRKKKPLTQGELDKIAQKYKNILIPYLIDEQKKGNIESWDIAFRGNIMRASVRIKPNVSASFHVNYTPQLASVRRILKKRKL